MTMRMLIDARHREETRVAVVKGSRIEEFDFESAEHKQLKGNIYLAKVTRVEPSLQAAFVEYGGNRHGFLAFSEIHPDYYQIPKEDREALLREEAEHAEEEERLRAAEEDLEPIDGHHDDDGDTDGDRGGERDEDALMAADDGYQTLEASDSDALIDSLPLDDDEGGDDGLPSASNAAKGTDESAPEKLREKRMNLRHRYKIQDVIRRRQVLLVQVVKEERGNKGAALTSYLSLAGRYCVLMPNTTHGGGISRKISNAGDRKRLKSIMAELNLPKTMGCIVRTAGLQRTKTEIRRDFDYLARLWDEVRENTLGSAAPALIYQDSDLIKRAIRDIYNKDIDEVVIEGDEGYKQAKSFMRLLMPSHASRVKPYADTVPLFQRNGVEDQLAAMYNPVVQLKSGGYLVINPTEALVSIDINSGRSTREYGIEATAVGTNLEAASEIARQLRLRDMAGLVVIDFIDMENSGNVRKVERAMKNALADDRARIQVGRISSFGLMEMSRQRLRTGVLEASTRGCPHCEGTGLVRTASSAGLSALRMLEDEAGRGRGSQLRLTASKEAALYVLNRKRRELGEIEERYGVVIEVASDNEDEGARMTVDASGPPPAYRPRIEPPVLIEEEDEPFEDILDDDEEEDGDERVAASDDEDRPQGERTGERTRERASGDEGEGRGKRRRRRGKRSRPDDRQPFEAGVEADGDAARPADGEADDPTDEGTDVVTETAVGGEGERKRRGRRGGRRRRGRDGERAPLDATGENIESVETGARADDLGLGEDEAQLEMDAPAASSEDGAVGNDVDDVDGELPLPAPIAAANDGLAEATTIESGGESGGAPNPSVSEADSDVAPIKPKRTRKPKAEATEAPGEGDTPLERPKRTRKKAVDTADASPTADTPADEPAPKPRRPRKKAAPELDIGDAPAAAPTTDEIEPPLALVAAPQEIALTSDAAVTDDATEAATDSVTADDQPKRGGWWQRTFGAQG